MPDASRPFVTSFASHTIKMPITSIDDVVALAAQGICIRVAIGSRIGSSFLPPARHGHHDKNPEKIIGNSFVLLGSENQHHSGWNN